jgi:hypothetical protein
VQVQVLVQEALTHELALTYKRDYAALCVFTRNVSRKVSP